MNLTGCFVAIVTPFKDGGVDQANLARHAEWLVDNRCSGIVVCGTTGEAATMSPEEKLTAMQVVGEAVGSRATVVGGAGNNSTSESLEFIARVDELPNVHAIMSVVPYYVKPDQAGIRAHFGAIASASRKPVIIYNVPGRTVVGMTAETMAAIAEHPNVVGIKEASGDLFLGAQLLARLRPGVAVFSGDDATAMPFMALGGHGVISVVGNVAPALMASLCRATIAGDLPSARALNFQVGPVHNLMFTHPSPVPAKIVTSALGFGSSDVRLPLVQVDGSAQAAILQRASALGISR